MKDYRYIAERRRQPERPDGSFTLNLVLLMCAIGLVVAILR